jgi:hypothetical protein
MLHNSIIEIKSSKSIHDQQVPDKKSHVIVIGISSQTAHNSYTSSAFISENQP